MLLINRKLIRLSKMSAGWIWAKVAVKLFMIVCIMMVYRLIAGVQGELYAGTLTIHSLQRALLLMVIVAVIRLLGNLADGELSYRCSASTRLTLRRRLYQKMLDLGVGYSIVAGTSNAVTTAVDGIESLETYFTDYLPVLIYCFIAPWIMFARMIRFAPASAWILLTASLLVMPLNQLFKKVVRMLSGEYWSNFSKLNAYYLESLEGLFTFKLFGADQKRTEELKNRSWTFRNSIMKTMRMNFNAATLTETVIYGSMAAAIICGSGLLESGNISFGRSIYLLLLTDTFFTPVRALLRSGHTAMNGIAAAENVFAMLELNPAYRNEKVAVDHREHPGETGLILSNVTFGYNKEQPVLHDISLQIPRGSVTAFVGLSGCGKSTLAGILMKFFDPDKGEIRLDGRNISAVPTEQYRKVIGIVPQNAYIFAGTVAENLRMAAPNASDEELWEVCRKVRLDRFLEEKQAGLQTQTGEGGNRLSGGQRQKLSIARTLLSRAEILIFDEATSNVDVESEADIWSCIHGISSEKTIIVIAHRLSTVRRADQICVLEHGRITECGSHTQLMKENGLYHKLVLEQEQLEQYGGGVC